VSIDIPEEDHDLENVELIEGDEPSLLDLDEKEEDPKDLGEGEPYTDDMPKDDMPENSWEGDPDDKQGEAGLTGRMEEKE